MKHRIALVDDDKNILASVSMALEAEGFIVEAYSDAETAVAAPSNRSAEPTAHGAAVGPIRA